MCGFRVRPRTGDSCSGRALVQRCRAAQPLPCTASPGCKTDGNGTMGHGAKDGRINTPHQQKTVLVIWLQVFVNKAKQCSFKNESADLFTVYSIL